MSQMCMFQPRYRQKIIVHERQSSAFERRLLWTEPKVDFLQLCVGVLTYELVRPREKLKEAILCIMDRKRREEMELQERIRSLDTVPQANRSNYENVMMDLQRVQSRTSSSVESTEDIFVYGHDAEKIDLVIKHALHEIISSRSNLKIANLTLNGPKVGNLTSTAYRELLTAEYSKHAKPDALVIILEEYTSNMFSCFRGSGFVEAKRAAGVDIIIVCCSTDQRDATHASIWREFKYQIFVPSSKDEEPWIPENSKKAAVDGNMVVHKYGVSTNHDPANERDDIYATVYKPPPRIHENEMARGRENEMMPSPRENQLKGQYVEVEVHQPKMNSGIRNGFAGPLETHANPIPSAADGNCIDSAYSTMHPVMKRPPQPPPKPTTLLQQPRREAEEQPVTWSKERSEFVALYVERPAVVGGGRPFDEFAAKEEASICDRIVSCIVGVFAFFMD